MRNDNGKPGKKIQDDESGQGLSKEASEFARLFKHKDLESYFSEQLMVVRLTGQALARLATIVRDSNDAILLLDLKGDIIAWNKGAISLYGYGEDQALQMNISAIVPPKEKRSNLDILHRIVEGENIRSYYTQRIARDGKVLDVWVTITALRDERGRPYAISTTERDVTEILRHELVKKERNEANFYVDLMTHDIRNMNQVALGYQELLENNPNLDEASKELVTNTIKAIDNVTGLIDNVKKFRILREEQVEHKAVSLNDVLLRVIKPYQGMEGVTIKYSPVSDYTVLASPLISDAFSNIVNNAIKHTKRPVTIDIRVNEQTENGKKCDRVTIEDNGPGIPDDRKEAIFERHLSRQKGYGSGVGLSLVRAIVEDSGGKVWVEDRVPGDYTKGARFVIMLPAVED